MNNYSQITSKAKSMTSFEIRKKLRDSLDQRGRLNDYIKSHMRVNGLDPDLPFEMTEDDERRVVIISQETGDEQQPEEDQI